MLKRMFCAALMCGTLAVPCLAQKSHWSLALSLANPGITHPYENPQKPGTSSGINGGYGGIAEKNFHNTGYALESILQYSLPHVGQLRLRGGYSIRTSTFSSTYASPDQTYKYKTTSGETARSWYLVPGFVGSHAMGRFSLTAGVEIPVYFLKPLETYNLWENLLEPEPDAAKNWRYFPGGTSLGLGPVAGMSYRLSRWISFGFELRSAFMFTHIKGNYKESINVSGVQQTETGTAEDYRNSGMGTLQAALQLRVNL